MLDWWVTQLRNERAIPDATLAAFFVVLDTAVTLVGASWWPAHPGSVAWTLLGVQALAASSLVLRRRTPMTVVAILGGFSLAVELLAGPFGVLTPANDRTVWAPFATILAAYAPVRWSADRRRAFAAIAVLTVIVARPWQPETLVIAVGGLRTAFGPLLALYVLARRDLVRVLTERAERAEREQSLLAERARVEERVRLAGEMHDVVTHRVNLMVLHAGALQLTAPDPATRRAADELRTSGCQALDELRDLLGVLRSTPLPDAPADADGIRELVAQSVAAGMSVTLTENGDPARSSPLVTRTACRVVRESLTNAAKHAPGGRVVVRVEHGETELRMSVHNSAPPRRPDPRLAATGSGLGLAALGQRVDVVHGTLRAGPTAEGGFCVDVTMPAYVATAQAAGSR